MSGYESGISSKNKSAIFLHIQKTAGTSIVDSLRQHYRENHIISHGDYLRAVPYPTNETSIDAEFVANLRNVRFLSGHFGYDFAKPFMPERYSFTFLRDPVERVLSFYYFCQTRDPKEYEIYRLCQESPLDEFLRNAMAQPEIKSLVWNNQVWQLACGYGNRENLDPSLFEPEKLLSLSISHLDDFSYVGFTETFEQDRERIFLHLGVPSHAEKFASNSTPGRPTAKDLSRSTLALLAHVTELDQVLYAEARARREKKPIKHRKPMNNSPHTLPERKISMPQDQPANKPDSPLDELQRVRNSYLELMQSCLTGSIYRDRPQAPFGPTTFDPYLREHGLDWPAQAQTMIGIKRLANLRALIESVIAEKVPGDLIETGVWRGGACILARAVLFAYNVTDRHIWAADSFEGLPQANEQQYPADVGSEFHKYQELAVTLEQVQDNFRAYGLLDEQTKFLKGWFKDTLPNAPIGQLALMRLDGDMYESTTDALTSLYPRLSPGGYVIIDDYHVVPACKAAVEDYCAANGLQPEIMEIDGVGVYWRKPGMTKIKDESAGPERGIESSKAQIGRLHQAISELSLNVITQLDHCLTVRDEHINALNHALTEQNHTIDEQNQAIEERNQAIAERDGRIADYNIDLAELNRQVKAVLASTSWRITSPIREIKGLLNAVRSRSPAEADSGAATGMVSGSGHDVAASEKPDYSQARQENDTTLSETESPNLFQTRPRVNKPPAVSWRDDFHLKVDDINFHLEWDSEELRNGVSTADDFLLGKNRSMVEKLVEMEQQQRISKIFEMGIFKGGSVALHDTIFRPLKIAAIEYTSQPVAALTEYISKYNKHNSVKPYYGVSQADRPELEKILFREFPKRDIDLIVDDASHLYEETRDAFNISFPFLAPGGIYIIEDWAWAHWAGEAWQSEGSYFHGRTALSNLLIELFMLAASRPDFITDIDIGYSTITITKGQGAVPANFNIADHYLLRGKHFSAWL